MCRVGARRRERVVVPVVLVGGLLAGCGGGTGVAASTGAAASTDTASRPSTTTATPTPTLTASSSPSASSPTASSPTATSTPTATATATATAARWPKTVGEPQQGAPVWAVYLAVANSATDPALEQAVRDAAGIGYQAVVGDIACDDGAMQALGLDEYDYWSGATLYFATRADATTFATSYTAAVKRPKGLAEVNVGCLD